MNQLLEQAFKEASALPDEEQERLAQFLLAELESDRKWDELFARPESEAFLTRLAEQALADDREGRTTPLNPDAL